MEFTKLKYFEDSYVSQGRATIVDCGQDSQGRVRIVLDETIFYPQGGGQPYDTGFISSGSVKFSVDEVRFEGGYVYHYGKFGGSEIFVNGEDVELNVDMARRWLHCRLHSAGHLLDYVFQESGGGLEPLRGFHFPEGPYVEYAGEVNGDIEKLAEDIEVKMNEYILLGYEVRTEIVANLADLEERAYFIPSNLPFNKPIRLVTVYGEKGIPCGGTHVKDIKEIGKVAIKKIKIKGGNTKISYELV